MPTLPVLTPFPRGRIAPPPHIRQARHRVNQAVNGALLAALPVASMPVYDARTLGIVPPVDNQAQCGDCHLHSAAKACASAQMRSGVVPADGTFALAVSYLLNCHTNLGGCNGGDEYADAQTILSGGCPSQAEYGGDGATPGQCKVTTGMTLYTISQLLMCSQNDGVAATQDIKNCCHAYGYVSVAGAAGSDWDSVGNGTITGRSSDVNHAIGIVGWDDNHDNGDGSRGAWIMQNNWDITWGGNCANSVNPSPTTGGYAWIKYGADSIGTGAFVAIAATPSIPGQSPIPTPH